MRFSMMILIRIFRKYNLVLYEYGQKVSDPLLQYISNYILKSQNKPFITLRHQ